MITIKVESRNTVRVRNFRNEGRADQWMRKLARRGAPESARVVDRRPGRTALRTTLGEHPVVQDWREDGGVRYAA